MEGKKKWFKTWWGITLIVVLALGILAGIVNPENKSNTTTGNAISSDSSQENSGQSDNSASSNSNTTGKTISEQTNLNIEKGYVVTSENLEDFFPTREEIPTEFEGNAIPTNLDISSIQNANGLKSAKSMSIDKILAVYSTTASDISLDISIYEFTSEEQAKSYYDNSVSSIKSDGGYTQLSISSRATCFGYTEDDGLSAKFATIECYNKNIYFEIDGVSSNTLKKPDSDVKKMVSIIDGKIK
ncbi:Uncharacterised protein [uncultured archaeon]|nr:Uncharacterised protein [uncultured archaeon]